MEDKKRRCQPAHEVGPIVAAGDMSQFVKQDAVEFRLRNLLEENPGENDNGVQESRGERGNDFLGYEEPRGARNAGVREMLLETHHQIRASRPGAIPEAAETPVTMHNSAQ